MGSQRVRRDWATELNWTELNVSAKSVLSSRRFTGRTFWQLLVSDKFQIILLNWITKNLNENPNDFIKLLTERISYLMKSFSTANLKKPTRSIQFSSVQFSCSVVSSSSRLHESQHPRLPCPSPAPGVHSDSCLSSRWCHPAISTSVIPFSSCPQSLPASESFPMSQLFTWGGQSTGVSASAIFPPKKSKGWSPSEWTGWISLQSKGLSRVFSNTTVHYS